MKVFIGMVHRRTGPRTWTGSIFSSAWEADWIVSMFWLNHSFSKMGMDMLSRSGSWSLGFKELNGDL